MEAAGGPATSRTVREAENGGLSLAGAVCSPPFRGTVPFPTLDMGVIGLKRASGTSQNLLVVSSIWFMEDCVVFPGWPSGRVRGEHPEPSVSLEPSLMSL